MLEIRDFVLYAFNPEKGVAVPLFIIAVPYEVEKQGKALMEWLVPKLAMKHIILAYGWEYFLEDLSVALRKDDRVYVLPRVFVQ